MLRTQLTTSMSHLPRILGSTVLRPTPWLQDRKVHKRSDTFLKSPLEVPRSDQMPLVISDRIRRFPVIQVYFKPEGSSKNSFSKVLSEFKGKKYIRGFWKPISLEHQKKFIELAAEEAKKPLGAFNSHDYRKKRKVFGGKSLSSLLAYWHRQDPRKSRTQTIERMHRELKIESVKTEKEWFYDAKKVAGIAPEIFEEINGKLLHIGGEKLLTFEQTIAIATEKDNGNRAARDALVEANQRIIYKIIYTRFQGFLPHYEALMISAGYYILIKAAENFRTDKKTIFATTYAWRAVISGISRALKKEIKKTAAEIPLDKPIGYDDNNNLYKFIPDPNASKQSELELEDILRKQERLTREIILGSNMRNKERALDIFLDNLPPDRTLQQTGMRFNLTMEGVRFVCGKIKEIRDMDPRWIAFMKEATTQ